MDPRSRGLGGSPPYPTGEHPTRPESAGGHGLSGRDTYTHTRLHPRRGEQDRGAARYVSPPPVGRGTYLLTPWKGARLAGRSPTWANIGKHSLCHCLTPVGPWGRGLGGNAAPRVTPLRPPPPPPRKPLTGGLPAGRDPPPLGEGGPMGVASIQPQSTRLRGGIVCLPVGGPLSVKWITRGVPSCLPQVGGWAGAGRLPGDRAVIQ
jgi:hypothetical protein